MALRQFLQSHWAFFARTKRTRRALDQLLGQLPSSSVTLVNDPLKIEGVAELIVDRPWTTSRRSSRPGVSTFRSLSPGSLQQTPRLEEGREGRDGDGRGRCVKAQGQQPASRHRRQGPQEGQALRQEAVAGRYGNSSSTIFLTDIACAKSSQSAVRKSSHGPPHRRRSGRGGGLSYDVDGERDCHWRWRCLLCQGGPILYDSCIY